MSSKTVTDLSKVLDKTNLESPFSGVDAIYYINMDKSTDRNEHMKQQLSDPAFSGVPVTRIAAFDGAKDDIFKYLDFYRCAKNPRMMNSEYACTLSHFRAIHEFAMTDDPIALIFEDDVSTEFIPYWKKTMRQHIDDAPKDWEVLQLSYILFETVPTVEYELWEMKKNFVGAAAYLIKNDAAKRLINYLCQYSSPAMPKYTFGPEIPYYHHADRFLYCFFKTYSYNCAPFTYRDQNDSNIHPDHLDYHSESKERTKQLYLRYIKV